MSTKIENAKIKELKKEISRLKAEIKWKDAQISVNENSINICLNTLKDIDDITNSILGAIK